jgi:hypothetical protein
MSTTVGQGMIVLYIKLHDEWYSMFSPEAANEKGEET